MKRILWSFIGLLLVLIAVVITLPTLLSQKKVHSFLLEKYNERIQGKIQLEALSLGWTSGITVKNLEVFDAKDRSVFHLDELVLKEPLYRLLLNRHDIISVTLQKPQLALYTDKQKKSSIINVLDERKNAHPSSQTHQEKALKKDTKPSAEIKLPTKTVPPELHIPFSVDFQLHDGSVLIEEDEKTISVSSIELACSLDHTNKALFSLSADVTKGNEKGFLRGKATLSSFEHILQSYQEKILSLQEITPPQGTDYKSPDVAITVDCQHFPVAIFDNFLALTYPEAKGLLLQSIGNTLDLSLDHSFTNNVIKAKCKSQSNHLNAQFALVMDAASLSIPTGLQAQCIINPEAFNGVMQLIGTEYSLRAPFGLTLDIQPTAATLPLNREQGKIPLSASIAQNGPAILMNKLGRSLVMTSAASLTAESILEKINGIFTLNANENARSANVTVNTNIISLLKQCSIDTTLDMKGSFINVGSFFSPEIQPFEELVTQNSSFNATVNLADITKKTLTATTSLQSEKIQLQASAKALADKVIIQPLTCRIDLPSKLIAHYMPPSLQPKPSVSPIRININVHEAVVPGNKDFDSMRVDASCSISSFTVSPLPILTQLGVRQVECRLVKQENGPMESTTTAFFDFKNTPKHIQNLIGEEMRLAIHAKPSFENGSFCIMGGEIAATSETVQFNIPKLIVTNNTLSLPEKIAAALLIRPQLLRDYTANVALAKPTTAKLTVTIPEALPLDQINTLLQLTGELEAKEVTLCKENKEVLEVADLEGSFSYNGKRNDAKMTTHLSTQSGSHLQIDGLFQLPTQTSNLQIFTTGKAVNIHLSLIRSLFMQHPLLLLTGNTLNATWDAAWQGPLHQGNLLCAQFTTETIKGSVNLAGGKEIHAHENKTPLLIELNIPKTTYAAYMNEIAKGKEHIMPKNDLSLRCEVSRCFIPIEKMNVEQQQPLYAVLDGTTFDGKVTLKEVLFESKKATAGIAFKPMNCQVSLEKGTRTLLIKMQQEKGAIHSGGVLSPHIEATGKIQNLWNDQQLTPEASKINATAAVKQFPIETLEILMGGSPAIEKAAILSGSAINLEAIAEIQHLEEGIIKADLNSKYLTGKLDGAIHKGIMTLKGPLHISLELTPEAGKKVFKDISPLVTSAYGKKPIIIALSNKGFSLPIKDFATSKIRIESGTIDFGQLRVKNSGTIASILTFLRAKVSKDQEINLWMTPIYFSMINGAIYCKRSDALVADTIEIATWGTVDIARDQLQMTLGISGETLKRSLGITPPSQDYMMQISISGTTANPKIDTTTATGKLAGMTLRQKAKSEKLAIIGGLLEAASQAASNESPPPPPTTYPFPWRK